MTTFRDTRQCSYACHTILYFQNLERFWEVAELGPNFGPTVEATDELKAIQLYRSGLSSSQKVLLGVAFDFWNGAGRASIWDIQSYLNVNVIHAIGELLIAANENPQLKGEPVDKWLSTWKRFRVLDPTPGLTVG